MIKPTEILEFWKEIGPDGWWEKNESVDNTIRERFGPAHEQATKGNLNEWKKTADECLALVILLDQLSRNLFRGSPKSFSQDNQGLDIVKHALSHGFDRQCDSELMKFFYVPFMHSEAIAEQEKCVILMHSTQDEDSINAALVHREIIARFGRFPHRNEVLDRHTTPAERSFLDQGGFTG